ncbi:MAG TPA: penicillin-binding transpeptidase domain-containing protein [Candidatus Koribacter sp.]
MAKEAAIPNAKRRLFFMGGALFLWSVVICFRLVQLQVFKYGEYVQKAARQQQRTITVDPPRGIVYDRNGHPLAMSVSVDSIFAVPSEVPDQASTAHLLGKILDVDSDEILNHFKASRSFAWVARKVDQDKSDRVHALNLRGIYFQKESKRYYPKRELAAQVLGYVGMDGNGLAGAELQYDNDLKGIPGRMMITMDARRKWFGRIEKNPDPGANVVLTIDENIQYIAERELEQAMQDTHAVAGTVVVQNPKTGEILALANRPTFNPNLTKEITPALLKNHAVSDVYEPGSVFKTVTYSSALEEHLTNPEEMVTCDPGFIVVGGIRIRDAHHVGVVPVSKAYAESSDVAAVKMGLRLGPDKFYKHIKEFGFGQQTGIELPGETRGLIKPPSRWSGSSIGSMSIGQEVGVTPLQVISMVSSIANDGIYTAPRIVADVTQPQQGYRQIVFHPKDQRRVISSMTAAQMRSMMQQVVLEGTARRAILNGYTAAGKTGTAQKVDPKTHLYSKTDYVGSFVGFAPVNNPALTVAVILDSAKGLHQGGQVSAPVFNRIMQQALEYLNVPHDAEIRNDPKRQLLLANVKDSDLEEGGALDREGPGPDFSEGDTPAKSDSTPVVAAKAPSASIGAHIVPTALAAAPTPAAPIQTPLAAAATAGASAENAAGSPMTVDVGSGLVVPSLIGKSVRGVVEAAQHDGFEVSLVGSGIAREQTPVAGARLAPGARVTVRFSR